MLCYHYSALLIPMSKSPSDVVLQHSPLERCCCQAYVDGSSRPTTTFYCTILQRIIDNKTAYPSRSVKRASKTYNTLQLLAPTKHYNAMCRLDSALNLSPPSLCPLTCHRWPNTICILLLQNLANQISPAGPYMSACWFSGSVEQERGHLHASIMSTLELCLDRCQPAQTTHYTLLLHSPQNCECICAALHHGTRYQVAVT